MTPREQQEREREQRREDLSVVLALPAGRRAIARWLAELYGTYYGEGSEASLRVFAALHDKAVALEAELMRASPEGYRLLRTEMLGETLNNLRGD